MSSAEMDIVKKLQDERVQRLLAMSDVVLRQAAEIERLNAELAEITSAYRAFLLQLSAHKDRPDE